MRKLPRRTHPDWLTTQCGCQRRLGYARPSSELRETPSPPGEGNSNRISRQHHDQTSVAFSDTDETAHRDLLAQWRKGSDSDPINSPSLVSAAPDRWSATWPQLELKVRRHEPIAQHRGALVPSRNRQQQRMKANRSVLWLGLGMTQGRRRCELDGFGGTARGRPPRPREARKAGASVLKSRSVFGLWLAERTPRGHLL